jgi:NAD(P)-dependent dehydrogenase (short-subunit alcohol dehydrogenase family)
MLLRAVLPGFNNKGITGMAFSGQSTASEVIAGIDLSGKTALVTGASAGLGIETVKALAGAGARVVMLARDPEKLATAREGILAELPAAQLETGLLDLADLASVRSAAAELSARFPQIHLLVNNAGVMACAQGATANGFEMQFGTNHLGHFLFTCLLAPALLAAAPARVVMLSSAGHKFSSVDLADPNYTLRPYDKWQAYGQSKTANALFAVALNQRLADRGVTANAVHPGMIVTELGRHLDDSDIEMLMARAEGRKSGFKSIPQGAATSVWAATSPQLEGRGGLYLEDCQIGEPEQAGNPDGGYSDYLLDAELAQQLWLLSEELLDEQISL